MWSSLISLLICESLVFRQRILIRKKLSVILVICNFFNSLFHQKKSIFWRICHSVPCYRHVEVGRLGHPHFLAMNIRPFFYFHMQINMCLVTIYENSSECEKCKIWIEPIYNIGKNVRFPLPFLSVLSSNNLGFARLQLGKTFLSIVNNFRQVNSQHPSHTLWKSMLRTIALSVVVNSWNCVWSKI